MNMRTKAATGKAFKAQYRRSRNLERPTAPKTIGTDGSASRKQRSRSAPALLKSLRLRVCAKVSRRPVDFLAIFIAGVTSIVIIINAAFWQSGPRIYEHEQLFSKLQKTRESLKSEGERLQHKIDRRRVEINQGPR
jgi:hypothetical protein